MEPAIFWLSGIAFFAVQTSILLRLLKARRQADDGRSIAIHAEIIWTLIPAAFVAALALMLLDRGPLGAPVRSSAPSMQEALR